MKPKMSRREFLQGVARDGGRLTVESALSAYTGTIKQLSPSRAQSVGLTEMSVADSCTLCNACTESCPQQAIAIHEGEMLFQYERCTGCGDCARVCPEHAIALTELKNPHKLSSRLVYKDEMIRCKSCNATYVSAKMLRKLTATLQTDIPAGQLCPNCRQNEVYRKIVGSTRNTV